eukprot:g767.t1
MLVKSSTSFQRQIPTRVTSPRPKVIRSIVEHGFRWESRRSRLRQSRSSTLTQEHHETDSDGNSLEFHGLHHVGLLCKNLEASMKFYCEVLGLSVNSDRPHKKLPYKGAWLWVGVEMIHLMELPNPDPEIGRPVHGGRDRHICLGIAALDPLIAKLKQHGIAFTESASGRRAVFFRDPDSNCVEVFETVIWNKGPNAN